MKYLKENNYIILETNFYCYFGEIDIIARNNGYLVFIEVKYRKSRSMGLPEEAVTYSKQRRIYKSAEYFLYKNRISMNIPCRFDVVAIMNKEIVLYKNAFGGF